MVPRETWQISSPDLELESPVHVLARVRTSLMTAGLEQLGLEQVKSPQ